MGLAGGDNKRNTQAIAIFALLLSFASFSFVNLVTRPIACFPGDIGTAKCVLQPGTHDITSLGTWISMPPASSCGTGNTSASICELMGNQTYRGILKSITSSGESGFNVAPQIGCISPSNTVGAMLQLQYANYSDTTHTNSSNFANVGAGIFIDNSAGWPCPGNLETTGGSLPTLTTNPADFIFRYVGIGGGGSGDNPRFSSASVNIVQVARNLITGWATGITNVHFTGAIALAYALAAASTTENFQWFATNTTSTGCGLSTDNCWEHGTSSCAILTTTSICSVTVTFTTAFTGTPGVIVNPTNTPGLVSLSIGTISLLMAQTLTV